MHSKRVVALLILAVIAGSVPASATTSGIAGLGPGVSRSTIKIGYHSPLTGAAPLPADSVDR
ncbi:MAG: hypothetical protein M3238_03540, partial [Actinomycetota bacterium]|nr:hypothetical protein [Actinomycetota bacterium]